MATSSRSKSKNSPMTEEESNFFGSAEYRKFRDSHELLAKLLAGEDIHVFFSQKIKHPAVFDLIRRVLAIAPLRKHQLHLTMGLIVHEIGHALFTNPTAADLKKMKGISTIMNIVEDGYQERQVCIKYPGGKKYLLEVFEHFFSDDEEETLAQKVKALLSGQPKSRVIELVNILNYNCKGFKFGKYKEYPSYVEFDDLKMLREAEMLNEPVYAERRLFVIDLCKMLKKYLNEDEKMPQDEDNSQGESPSQGNGNSEEDNQKFWEDDEDEIKSKDNSGSGDGDEDGEESEDDNDSNDDAQGNESSNKKNGDEKKPKKGKTEKNDSENEDGDESQSQDDNSGESDDSKSGKKPDGKKESGKGSESNKNESEDSGDDGESEEKDSSSESSGDSGDDEKSSGNAQEKPQGSKGAGSENDDFNPDDIDLDELLNEEPDLLNDHHTKLDQVYDKENGEQTIAIYNLPTFEMLNHVSLITDIAMHGKNDRLKSLMENATYKTQIDKDFPKCRHEARLVANTIYQRFSQKQATHNIAKTSYRKSGSLDATRAALFQITDDIFSNSEITPNVTNHGYVVMLDWSGSMSDSCLALTHRIMELTYFAEMAEVELEVWLYTTRNLGYNGKKATEYPFHLMNDSGFIKVLNTKQHSRLDCDRRLQVLYLVARYHNDTDYFYYNTRKEFGDIVQGGTNILEGVVYGAGILERMKAEKKTLIVLTDGNDEQAFESVYDTDKKIGNNVIPTDAFFNGVPVSHIIEKMNTRYHTYFRSFATRIYCDFYKRMGYRVVGVSWNCRYNEVAENNFKFGNKSLNIESPPVKSGEYTKMDNAFISEMTENLI